MKRISRPIGTTELGKQYNLTHDEEKYQQLKTNIIHHYIRNNFSYCGNHMNIEQFSRYINIPISEIQKQITEFGSSMGNMGIMEISNGKDGKDFIRAIQNLLVNFAFEDRSLAIQQLNIMRSSQGAEYVPFISGEVNRSLKLVMDSSINMANVFKMLLPTGSSKFEIIEENNAPMSTQNGVTVDDVISILKTSDVIPLKEDNTAQDKLFIEYDIDKTPEVNAMMQQGYDKSKEALNLKNITALSPEKLKELQSKEDKDERHTNRRANDFDFDFSSDQI